MENKKIIALNDEENYYLLSLLNVFDAYKNVIGKMLNDGIFDKKPELIKKIYKKYEKASFEFIMEILRLSGTRMENLKYFEYSCTGSSLSVTIEENTFKLHEYNINTLKIADPAYAERFSEFVRGK